jgi:hypothetical protein
MMYGRAVANPDVIILLVRALVLEAKHTIVAQMDGRLIPVVQEAIQQSLFLLHPTPELQAKL